MFDLRLVLRQVQNFVRRNLLWILAGLLVLWAVFIRYEHLLDHNYYYMLSPDSYFFHWRAGRFMLGQGPPPDTLANALPLYNLHIGLAPALAYVAKAAQVVLGMSPQVALDFACKLVPLVLGVVFLSTVFIIGYKMWGRRVGMLSAFAGAGLGYAIVIFSSGFVDREGLSLLLVMAGTCVFYISKYWKMKIQGRDVGWLVAGLIIILMEILLYLEWDFQASMLLFAVILAYFVLRALIGLWNNREIKRERLRLIAALREANWMTFAFILVINGLAAAAMYSRVTYSVNFIRVIISTPRSVIGVAEYGGLTVGDLFTYHLWWIPMVVALYLTLRTRKDYYLFISLWFLIVLGASVFLRRLFVFTVPPACLLAGVGLDYLWGPVGASSISLKKVGVVALVILLVSLSTLQGAGLQKSYAYSIDGQWQDALLYIREDTPTSAVFASTWTYGYWILDIGQRKPYVDNGFYGYDSERLYNVGRIYVTTDDAEAVGIMKSEGIDYIVFSKLDTDVETLIMGWGGIKDRPDFPRYSLYSRSMGGNFTSNAGLEVVYSSPKSETDYVVILGLNHQGTSSDSNQSP